MNSDENGWVYVGLNPAFPKQLKFGITERTPEERAKELSGTGVPDDFIILYAMLTPDYKMVEKNLQEKFAHSRYKKEKEFFTINPTDAINALIEEVNKLAESPEVSISTESELLYSIENASEKLFFMGMNISALYQRLLEIIPNKLDNGVAVEIILPALSEENMKQFNQRDIWQNLVEGNHLRNYEQTMRWFNTEKQLGNRDGLQMKTIPEIPFGFVAIIDNNLMFWTPYLPCGLSKNMVRLKVIKSEVQYSPWQFLMRSIDHLTRLTVSKSEIFDQNTSKREEESTKESLEFLPPPTIETMQGFYIPIMQQLKSISSTQPVDYNSLKAKLKELESFCNDYGRDFPFQQPYSKTIKRILIIAFAPGEDVDLSPVFVFLELLKSRNDVVFSGLLEHLKTLWKTRFEELVDWATELHHENRLNKMENLDIYFCRMLQKIEVEEQDLEEFAEISLKWYFKAPSGRIPETALFCGLALKEKNRNRISQLIARLRNPDTAARLDTYHDAIFNRKSIIWTS